MEIGGKMLKEAIKAYLDQYFRMYKIEWNSFPTVSLEEEDRISTLYVGEEDEEGRIQWIYKPADIIVDFTELEKKHAIVIPYEIKEYYNSYWFFMFGATFENESIYFDSIDESSDIVLELDDWFTHGVKDKIIIGHGKWNAPLCVKVDTGEVIIWEEDSQRERVLANSLEELFRKMMVNINA